MVVSNIIDYYSIDTTADAADFGDLTLARESPCGVSDNTYAVFAGGQNGVTAPVIDYITIDTPATASGFGDLSERTSSMAGVDDSK